MQQPRRTSTMMLHTMTMRYPMCSYSSYIKIAEKILHQPPTATNYFGNKEVGTFIGDIMKSGATKDWREVMKEATGEEMNAKRLSSVISIRS